MSRKHFSGLLVAVVVVLIAVFALLPSRTGQIDQPSDLLLPDLAARINDVDQLRVSVAGGEVVATLERGETQWTIAELHGYPADWAKLRGVLAALAQARVLEEKTANPEFHDRLGVEDIGGEAASGVLLTLRVDGAGQGIIIGDTAGQRSGRYLRRADSPLSVLADFEAEVPREALGWAATEVADLAADNVAEVEIIHPDRDRILVRKATADDTDYTLDNLPPGRELQSSWSANALGGVLASLVMEDVRPSDELDWQQPLLVRVLTFDGMEVRVEAVDAEDAHWLRLSAAAPFLQTGEAQAATPGAGEVVSADDAPVADDAPPAGEHANDAAGSAEGDLAASAGEDLSARVAAFNARVGGWAYKVPGYKYEAMSKRLEDLLKPPEDEADDA